MPKWLRKLWPVLKWILTIVILLAIGRRFYLDLKSNPELLRHVPHLGWTTAAGVLYILALGCFSRYWARLLTRLGQHPTRTGTLKAYFLGLLGKYLPGKVGALVMRAEIAGTYGIPRGLAYMTSFYEVLTTMTAGALLAAVLAGVFGPNSNSFDWSEYRHLLHTARPELIVIGRGVLVILSLFLAAGVGFWVLPPVFNRVANTIARPFRNPDSPPYPRLTWPGLLEGLAYGAVGWLLMGLSLCAALVAVLGEPAWDGPFLGRTIAYMGLGYVAGFVIVWMPSGLGVREFFLTLLLAPGISSQFDIAGADAIPQAELVVLLLRLSWTVAEVVTAAAVWGLPQGETHTARAL